MPILQLPLVLLVMLALGACGGSVTPTASELPVLTSAQLLQPGPFGIGVTTMTFEDTGRPTMPNSTFPGSPTVPRPHSGPYEFRVSGGGGRCRTTSG